MKIECDLSSTSSHIFYEDDDVCVWYYDDVF